MRAGPDDQVTVGIAGGPPGAVATIQIAGIVLRRVRLDACGTGRVVVDDCEVSGPVEITVDDRVLLTGTLPRSTAGSGA